MIASMTFLKRLIISGILCLVAASACSIPGESSVPADFLFVLDADSGEDVAQNVNIRINAQGEGQYERYNTEGAIRFDENQRLTYKAEQIVDRGEFRVTENELEELWETIDENGIFNLTGDYRMAIGHSYAVIVVTAQGRRHQVFNIGMDVPEVRAVVEATRNVLPEGVDVVYREGFVLGTGGDSSIPLPRTAQSDIP